MRVILPLVLFLFLSGAAGAAEQAMVQIDEQEMAQVVEDYLAEQSQLLPHVELKLDSAKYPDAFEVPEGQIEHEIVPSKPGVVGSRRLTLMTRVDGRTVGNRSIRIELGAYAEIVVTASSLEREEILDSSKVELAYQDISGLKAPIFSIEEIVGQMVKRSVRNGTALQQSQVEFPPVVLRGEQVVIEAQGHGLSISAAGEAKQDGRIGESIRVVNNSSNKELLCQVVAVGVVRVQF